MHTVTLDELEINAIGAALDERNLRLSEALGRLVTRARHAILEAIEEPEPAPTMTYAMFEGMGDYTEAELRESFGR